MGCGAEWFGPGEEVMINVPVQTQADLIASASADIQRAIADYGFEVCAAEAGRIFATANV